jgi:hypothetical protein
MLKYQKFTSLIAAGAFAIVGLGVTGASAATLLNVTGDVDKSGGNPMLYSYNADFIRGTLYCSLGCEGLTISTASFTGASGDSGYPTVINATGFGTTNAELYVGGDSGADTELGQANMITSGNYLVGDKYNLDGSDNKEDYTWTTNAQYILLKIGNLPDVTFIRNTGGYGNVFTYVKAEGGHGLSHFNGFGEYECPEGTPGCGGGVTPPSPVPLPAGMPLLLVGLGALGFMRRKSRKAA